MGMDELIVECISAYFAANQLTWIRYDINRYSLFRHRHPVDVVDTNDRTSLKTFGKNGDIAFDCYFACHRNGVSSAACLFDEISTKPLISRIIEKIVKREVLCFINW